MRENATDIRLNVRDSLAVLVPSVHTTVVRLSSNSERLFWQPVNFSSGMDFIHVRVSPALALHFASRLTWILAQMQLTRRLNRACQ